MSIISVPASLGIINLQWAQPPGYQVNRSELTGVTRTVQLGPAERWNASGRLVPRGNADLVTVRGFLANMKRPGNFARLPMVETPQVKTFGYPTLVLVNGAGQLGYSLNLKGLQPSVTNLLAGDIITIFLDGPNGIWQPIVLTADLVANGSGNGTASLSTPLRKSPGNNDEVELSVPTCTVRMRDPMAWEVTPGGVYLPGDFVAEEAF